MPKKTKVENKEEVKAETPVQEAKKEEAKKEEQQNQ